MEQQSKVTAIALSVTLVGSLLLRAVLASHKKPRRRTCSRWSIQRASLWGAFWIENVRVPIANIPEALLKDKAGTIADDEGLVHCHIYIKGGKIQEIQVFSSSEKEETTTPAPPRKGFWCPPTTVKGHGCLFLPCFVDAHTHLVKTQTVPRNRNRTGTMSEAYAVEMTDEPNWADTASVFRLMDFGVQCAQHYGTMAMRTHLDGCASEDPKVVQAVYQAYDALVQKYKGVVLLQGVANLFLPLWLNEPLATQHSNRAAEHSNVLLGAYIGNPPIQERVQTVEAMVALLAHAQRLDLDVDMHIDESNDPSCCALLCLIEALKHARKQGFQGRVVLGHCCALSLQDKETQANICRELAQLGPVYVVANPYTNVGLQDRRGSCRPLGLPIPANVPRTPQWRGLTLLQELDAAGVTVSVASDNVRDHWHPYGDYDLLAVWACSLLLGHLDTIPSAGAWAHLCTDSPARAMGLTSTTTTTTGCLLFQPGQPADGILFPQARRMSELLARPQTDRIVLRSGQVQTTQLPDFAELDDLVATPMPRPAPEAYLSNPQQEHQE